MTPSLVLDIETRLDPLAVAASGRRSAPRDMPEPLQFVTAVAMLAFERHEDGRFDSFSLTSLQTGRDDERHVVAAARELSRIHSCGGELITYNGSHDLGVLRFAALRHRDLGDGAALRWLGETGGRHRDAILAFGRDGQRPRLADVAAGLGFGCVEQATRARSFAVEREKAEVDVARTMLVHIHLEAERLGDARALSSGAIAVGRFLMRHSRNRPHFAALLRSPLYASASRTLAGDDRDRYGDAFARLLVGDEDRPPCRFLLSGGSGKVR